MPLSRAQTHAHRHMRSSRRMPALTDKDIDHEIEILDHDDSMKLRRAASLGQQTTQTNIPANLSAPIRPLDRSESTAPLTKPTPRTSEDGNLSNDEEPSVPGPSQTIEDNPVSQREPSTLKEPEWEIDILYENQRGGFLCGIPLFSSAALGNLDPPAWTNFAHKPSPTDISNAQVPDPSWQWAWPEWRINHDDQIQTDGDGWEYSFMFSKKFSWHGPKWYNSFVRRRAWIRRRIKIGFGYQAQDEHAMNPAYFTITPRQQERASLVTATELVRASSERQSRRSQEDSRRSRDRSRGDVNDTQLTIQVKTCEEMTALLKRSRVDRERLEAVENYFENCTDEFLPLQDCMHEIMSVFVFQASRKRLLARLTHLYDDVSSTTCKGKSSTTSKADNLAEALKHADEEVRRLEYWSDIKGMAENGEAVRAVDHDKGWDSGWQGLDKSGAKGINEDELP